MKTRRIVQYAFTLLAISLACVLAAPLRAGVFLDSTRVIYPAREGQITVSVTNDEKTLPLLVQAWIDDGREQATPTQLDVPFLLTPPIFRIEPGKARALRISYLKNKPLPADKESVFWLNVLEVPPKPKAAKGEERNTMQLAFRTRIKLFFRPKDLKGAAADAPGKLRWTLVTEGSERALQAENPTSYYVSFESVGLSVDGETIKSDNPAMIAPGAMQRFPLKDVHPAAGSKLEVHFSNINDYGQFVAHTAALMP